MTATAAAAASAPIAASAPRPAPQPATDCRAFSAVLDSLPGAQAKASSAASEDGPRTSNAQSQRDASPSSGQPDIPPVLGDGAFLSALAFVLPSASVSDGRPAAALDARQPEPGSMEGSKAEESQTTSPTGAGQQPDSTVGARLVAQRAFHLSRSAFGGFAEFPPTEGALASDAPTFAQAAASAVAADRAGAAAPGLPVNVAPAASAPIAPRVNESPTGRPPSASRSSAQGLSRSGLKSQSGPPLSARAASSAAPPAPQGPSGSAADAGPANAASPGAQPASSGGQPAAAGGMAGAAQLSPFAAAMPFGARGAAGATYATPTASPLPASQTTAAPPVKEIEVDLSPGGLEDVSMTMRLAGDKLSVVIRAASSQTHGSIESVREAIVDRLAAIGQPLDSLVIQLMGANADANTNGKAASDEGSTGGERRPGQGAGEQGASGDPGASRRGGSGNLRS